MTAQVKQKCADNIGPVPSSVLYPLGDDADFALRTGDGVLFGLHRALLKRASPVMSDMLMLGDAKPCVACDKPVRTQEDSKTLENLLSFIYPDQEPVVFDDLDEFLNVLKAASKYQMAVVVNALTQQVTSSRLKDKVIHQPLMYKDPLRVFATAKHLAIDRLSLITREATLSVDIHGNATRSIEASTLSALWLWELEDIRRERWIWLKDRCGTSPNPLYTSYRSVSTFLGGTVYSNSNVLFNKVTCPLHDNKVALAKVLERIRDFPCPKTIREINFNSELKCERCGDASYAFFKRICEEYEVKFGRF